MIVIIRIILTCISQCLLRDKPPQNSVVTTPNSDFLARGSEGGGGLWWAGFGCIIPACRLSSGLCPHLLMLPEPVVPQDRSPQQKSASSLRRRIEYLPSLTATSPSPQGKAGSLLPHQQRPGRSPNPAGGGGNGQPVQDPTFFTGRWGEQRVGTCSALRCVQDTGALPLGSEADPAPPCPHRLGQFFSLPVEAGRGSDAL